tara:strand:+ start:299 stop:1306 length:1008 start_codon:yes stop_codon:yes gene_type:complete
MAAIALRSPQYRSAVSDTGNPASAKLELTIDGTLRYTLVKSTSLNSKMTWEIAELCRDYLNIIFTGTAYTAETVTIVAQLTSHASTDGSGTALTTDRFPSSGNDIGYDGYGTFMQGSNPEIPFDNRPRWLISTDPNTPDVYYIYVPNNTAGTIPWMNVNGDLFYYTYTANQTQVIGGGYGQYNVNINRIDCTKYGDGHKITFVNKFGALQDLWFFLKIVNTTSKKQERFQRSIITGSGSYDVNSHMKTDFNTVANQTMTLSSGYYPEWASQWFEQLLLSEQVWLTRTDPFDSSDSETVPVNVIKNSMVQKTSVNDRLIDYTFEFQMAADYINNVR